VTSFFFLSLPSEFIGSPFVLLALFFGSLLFSADSESSNRARPFFQTAFFCFCPPCRDSTPFFDPERPFSTFPLGASLYFLPCLRDPSFLFNRFFWIPVLFSSHFLQKQSLLTSVGAFPMFSPPPLAWCRPTVWKKQHTARPSQISPLFFEAVSQSPPDSSPRSVPSLDTQKVLCPSFFNRIGFPPVKRAPPQQRNVEDEDFPMYLLLFLRSFPISS